MAPRPFTATQVATRLAYHAEGAAVEHLDFAIREFQDMKMTPSLERALQHRELLRA